MSPMVEVMTHRTSKMSGAPAHRLWVLLGFILLMLIMVECFTRVLHNHRRVTLSVEGGIQRALAIRRIDERIRVLFVGNSLIYEGLSESTLQQGMPPEFLVSTAGVPGSTYYDWLYGLRALFKRGSQPDVVVFGISPSQFLRPATVTALPIARLWRRQELVSYYRERQPTLTAMSDLVFEHYSTFFCMRDTIRIYVRKVIPGYESMVNQWTRVAPPASTLPDRSFVTHSSMYAKLATLQRQFPSSTRLILIIVPTNQLDDSVLEPGLLSAARELGIAVIEPVSEQAWPVTSFQPDHYHLTEAAAVRFSVLTTADLTKILKTDTSQRYPETTTY